LVTEEEIVDQLCIHELSASVASQSSLSINLDTVVDLPKQSQKTIPLRPIMFITPALIQQEPCKKFLSALLDTGSDISLIHQRCLPAGITPTKVEPRSVIGLHQACQYEHEVVLQDIVLPELSPSKSITQFPFLVSTHDSSPDVILGNDFLNAIGIIPDPVTRTIKWFHHVLPWKQYSDLPKAKFNLVQGIYLSQAEDEDVLEVHTIHHQGSIEIKEAKYGKVEPELVATQQKHLSTSQQGELAHVLCNFSRLFSGMLGKYPYKKVHLELQPNAKPVRKRPYAVAFAHQPLFLKELTRLCGVGVLEKTGASEWGAPTFIIPKKDGTIRWVSDFRGLNKLIKRKVYPLPIITDVLRRRSGYKYFTKLDISMQYYTFELDDESKQVCVIVTPFGNYRYNRLPMGVNQSPDIAQEIMETVLHDIPDCEVYLDDVGIFSNSWEEHLQVLEQVLQRLQENNFTINPLKCEWAVQKTDWLGYWLTPTGLKP